MAAARYFWCRAKWADDGTHDDVWRRSIVQIRKVLPVASRLGVRICIETVWNKFCEKPEQLRDYVDEINSPWFGVWLDIGNVRKFAPSEELGARSRHTNRANWT